MARWHKRYKKRTLPEMPDQRVKVELSIDLREPQWLIDAFKMACDPDLLHIGVFEVGDYFYGKKLGIERKSPTDFVMSIPKVFAQVQELRGAFEIPYLLIDGDFSLLFSTHRHISPRAIIGALTSIKAHYDVNIMFTNQAHIVNTVLSLIEKHTDSTAVPYTPMRPRPTNEDYQVHVLTSLPHVGPATAKDILKRYGSVMNAFRHVEEWAKVPRITAERQREIAKILSEGSDDEAWEL